MGMGEIPLEDHKHNNTQDEINSHGVYKIDYIVCHFCGDPYIKGNGHTTWCGECSEIHMMCNPCMSEAKKNGAINENKGKMIYSRDTQKKER